MFVFPMWYCVTLTSLQILGLAIALWYRKPVDLTLTGLLATVSLLAGFGVI